MSYKFLFVLNALVAVALGAVFLIVPDRALGFFETETYAATLLVARFFGSALLALGLVLWFAKDSAEESVQKGMAIALLISAVLGLIVNVIGISPASGVIRANGWITIIVYVLFALGYAFMIFLKPKMKE
jgi:hypothetical protein